MLIGALFAVAMSPVIFALDGVFKVAAPGTVVVYSDEISGDSYENVMREPKGLRVFYDFNGDGRYAPYVGHFSHGVVWKGETTYDDQEVASLFPLAVGKSVSFKQEGKALTGRRWTAKFTITVIREEKVHIPAGDFDTFVVRFEDKPGLKGRYWAKNVYWYAPDVGLIVRAELRSSKVNFTLTATEIRTP